MPDIEWRVLSSGALACRLPSAGSKPVWLDAVRRVKVCEHGHSMSEIHHWRCGDRPRPAWVACDCTDAKGLWSKTKPELPEAPPPYNLVLWKQSTPTLLAPVNTMGVKVPGGREVYIDGEGRARCKHGLVDAVLRRRYTQTRVDAASKLQAWWRALDTPMRAAVRLALGFGEATQELQRAADVWRSCCSRRTRPPCPRKRKAETHCGCQPVGLRRYCFGTQQRRPTTKRQRENELPAPVLVEAVG
jgi:hypothetical protein